MRRKWLGNALLLLVSSAFALLLTEFLLRVRYSDPGYTPREEVKAVQAHLQLHPQLGFTWCPNVSAEDNIIFEIADVEYEPLCTDSFGFSNPPEAIARQMAGEPIDIIGLGDSFMEHAAHGFYKLFAEHGFFYYSMAIHRQCPPQYNTILERYALPLRPNWVVYGLFENDFEETEDFEHWRASTLDWFTFHSGTWCGPPRNISSTERFLKRHFRGMSGFARVLRERFGVPQSTPDLDVQARATKTLRYVTEAHELAKTNGGRFVVLLIPSKELALQGTSKGGPVLEAVAAKLRESQVPVIDLRESFAASADPSSLYYVVDGHWNRNGIQEAGGRLLRYIEERRERERQE